MSALRLANASLRVKTSTLRAVRLFRSPGRRSDGGGPRRLRVVQLQMHQVVAQGLDLQLRVTVEELAGRGGVRFVAEVPEAGHLRPVQQRLRVLQPGDDPVRPQALLREEEIGRRAAGVLPGAEL